MNRLDELTAQILDATLSASELAELETMLAARPADLDRYLQICELEAVLRGLRGGLDLSAATIRTIIEQRGERIADAVMREIATVPARAARHRRVGLGVGRPSAAQQPWSSWLSG